jgi:hypothetical protein
MNFQTEQRISSDAAEKPPKTQPEINILGNDYFSEVEAAHYACVSHSQFRKFCHDYGITARCQQQPESIPIAAA